MKLEKRRYDDVVILKFAGEFDGTNLPTFAGRIDQMIEAGDRQLVLDVLALKFINSSALGYLVKTSKRVKEQHGEMVLARPSRFLSKTLATLGLDTAFLAFKTVEDAIIHFKKGETVGTIDLSKSETDESLTGAVPLLFRKDDGKVSKDVPNQVGRIVTLYEDGLLFRYDPAPTGKDPIEADLAVGGKLKIKFRQPFAVKEYFFEMGGTIAESKKGAVDGDPKALAVRVRYDKIADADRKALQQFVRDLESWKAELKERS
jgi:anti-sigma B factor antagonist